MTALIHTRYSCGTNLARCNGKTASCTESAESAAKACARKVAGRRPLLGVTKVTDCLFVAEIQDTND